MCPCFLDYLSFWSALVFWTTFLSGVPFFLDYLSFWSALVSRVSLFLEYLCTSESETSNDKIHSNFMKESSYQIILLCMFFLTVPFSVRQKSRKQKSRNECCYWIKLCPPISVWLKKGLVWHVGCVLGHSFPAVAVIAVRLLGGGAICLPVCLTFSLIMHVTCFYLYNFLNLK